MTLTIPSRESKARSLSLLEQVLHTFLYPGMSPPNRQLVANHLEWMRRQPSQLKANVRFETFPEAKLTRVVLDLSFAEEVKPFETAQ